MKTTCPKCNSTDTCRIIYGLPAYTDELQRDLKAGKVRLGGCAITDSDPSCHCNNCGEDFDTKTPNNMSQQPQEPTETEEEKRKREDEEIVTIILPTINNDGK